MASILPIPGKTDPSINIVSARAGCERLLRERVPSDHFYPPAAITKLLECYSEKELELIYADFCDVEKKLFDGTSLAREYIAAAGGPASGKSTLLEGISENRNCPPGFVNNFKRVYIDPDRSCMVNMERTYLADLKSGMSSMDAYTKWRNASNFLSNVFLARALNEGYAIAHGTTLATPPSMKALQAIQNHYHYKTTLFHVTCDHEVRRAVRWCGVVGQI